MDFYFQKLIVWQKAFNVTKKVYELTKDFPSEERFSLTDQMKRSTVSVMSNIAEWSGRTTNNDRNHFYTMAKWSAMELASQLILAQSLWYIHDAKIYDECWWELEEIAKILFSFIK